jgi:preprotein translocase subunit YajC
LPYIAAWVVLMVGAFYLLLWRPQQRRVAAVRDLQARLHEGDEVMTTSGIYARITKLTDTEADLEIAPGTTIRVARGAIGQRIGPNNVADAGGAHDGDAGIQ